MFITSTVFRNPDQHSDRCKNTDRRDHGINIDHTDHVLCCQCSGTCRRTAGRNSIKQFGNCHQCRTPSIDHKMCCHRSKNTSCRLQQNAKRNAQYKSIAELIKVHVHQTKRQCGSKNRTPHTSLTISIIIETTERKFFADRRNDCHHNHIDPECILRQFRL